MPKVKENFSGDSACRVFGKLLEHTRDTPIDQFVSACKEMKNVLHALGGLSIANKDLNQKLEIISDRLETMQEREKKNGLKRKEPFTDDQKIEEETEDIRYTIQWIVKDEINRKVADSGNKRDKASITRCVYRLLWFFDLVEALVKEIMGTDKTMSQCASKAYDETLSPRHPWVVRKTIGVAMRTLPNREKFFNRIAPYSEIGPLSIDDVTSELGKKVLQEFEDEQGTPKFPPHIKEVMESKKSAEERREKMAADEKTNDTERSKDTPDLTSSETYVEEKFGLMMRLMRPLREHLWEFYRLHGVDNLK